MFKFNQELSNKGYLNEETQEQLQENMLRMKQKKQQKMLELDRWMQQVQEIMEAKEQASEEPPLQQHLNAHKK